jgi:hypothetical protein
MKGKTMREERRTQKRRKFGYYMQVFDHDTLNLIGYLSDISPQGFKLDSRKPLTVNKDYALRLDLTAEIAKKPYIGFIARVIWSRPDPMNPNEFVQGFKIITISPHEQEIFNIIVQKYGKAESIW